MRKLAFKVFTAIFFGFHDHDHVDLDMVDNLYTILNLGMKSMAINLSGFAFHRALKVSLSINSFCRCTHSASRADATCSHSRTYALSSRVH
ncbi:hypothetical protein AHAS_Ahas03G0020500 [Arachis hypogaea]